MINRQGENLRVIFVMAGLVPAIHVFLAYWEQRRGCPASAFAKASADSVQVRRSFSEGGHKAEHDEREERQRP
jgi:hypothetical protein